MTSQSQEVPQVSQPKIAVLIPCYNEEATIVDVVRDFQAQLPAADICVFDNNSSDRTVQKAMEANAKVFHERRQGKGFVVRSMFRGVEADIYVLVDGDGTYPAASAPELIAPLLNDDADMVIGSRLHAQSQSVFRPANRLGNGLFLLLMNSIFRVHLTDLLSGYRAFNRKFVKGIPLFGGGFEIETELTIKALERGYKVVEVPVDLAARPAGSHSKIRLVRDSVIILNTMFALLRDYRPLTFFGSIGLLLSGAGALVGLAAFDEFVGKGAVSRTPSAVFAVSLLLSGFLSASVGVILHTLVRRFQEFEHRLNLVVDELSNKNPGGRNRQPPGIQHGQL